MAQAHRGIIEEMDKMTKPGHTYRVDPGQVIVNNNIHSRSDGMPYSNAREPKAYIQYRDRSDVRGPAAIEEQRRLKCSIEN